MTTANDGELAHYTVDRGIARIELDSPHNRNALSRQLCAELDAHLTPRRQTIRQFALWNSLTPARCSAQASVRGSLWLNSGGNWRTIVGQWTH